MSAVLTPQAQETTDKVAIHANVDANVDYKECVFRFKKDNLGNKRDNVEGKIPVPSVQGLVTIIETGGKQLDLVLESLYDVVRSVAQEKVSNDENIKSLDQIPFKELSWEAIANMSKEDRRANAIPAEQWAAFTKKYIEVMPGMTSKPVEAITNHTVVYVKKFAQFKTDKETLRKLKTMLGLFGETAGAEEFSDILELLNKRADTYLAADDVAALRANL